ncbi:hypothetical protein C2S51_007764 [Perilla frutescens var. frutescens]|nr:hypothetical protein C2S51_007764 [Perilla frutescens var. frutescens]
MCEGDFITVKFIKETYSWKVTMYDSTGWCKNQPSLQPTAAGPSNRGGSSASDMLNSGGGVSTSSTLSRQSNAPNTCLLQDVPKAFAEAMGADSSTAVHWRTRVEKNGWWSCTAEQTMLEIGIMWSLLTGWCLLRRLLA